MSSTQNSCSQLQRNRHLPTPLGRFHGMLLNLSVSHFCTIIIGTHIFIYFSFINFDNKVLTKNSAMFWETKWMTFSFFAFSAQIDDFFFFIFFKLLIFAWFCGTPFEIIMVFSFFLRRVGTSWGDLYYGETRWCSTWSGKFCSTLHNLVLKNLFLVWLLRRFKQKKEISILKLGFFSMCYSRMS